MATTTRRALVALVTLAIVGLAGPAPAGSAVSDDPALAAHGAARWLETQVNDQGFVEGGGGGPSPGATLQLALSLATAQEGEATFDRIVEWARSDVDAAIQVGGVDDPGLIGYLLLVLDAAGEDPTTFGGTDLPVRLAATLGDFEADLYGAADPTFDGAFRQSLAILGLVAHGLTPPGAAVDWLVDQQCDAPTSAAGGWTSYRADTTVDCPPPDAGSFTGPDTNSTSLAVQAVESVGGSGAADPVAFLAAAQGDDGGFPFITGGTVDPNSTALVIQALVALGEDPAGGAWAQPDGDTPIASLLSWQLGCDSDDAGALTSPFSAGAADQFATLQGPWGLSERALPLGEATWAPVDPCAPPAPDEPTTTSVLTPSTAAPATASTATAPVAARATAVTATPTVTG